MGTKLANKTESTNNSPSDLPGESEKQIITSTEVLPNPEETPQKTPVNQEQEKVIAPTPQDGIQLPEPDPDNITVLTGKLPNKPILPWNHYDSPWEEEEEETELQPIAVAEEEVEVNLEQEKVEVKPEEEVNLEADNEEREIAPELDLEEVELDAPLQEEVVVAEKEEQTPHLLPKKELQQFYINEEEDYVELDEEIESDEVE